MFRYVAVISIIGGSLLAFSIFKLFSTTFEIYQKPKTNMDDKTKGEDKYKKTGAAP